jgi:hypothetical protein
MNVRALPRAAVTSSIRLARLPLDIAVTALPGDSGQARLALDRVDATARSLAGVLLADPVLREDAQRRRAAADERRRADALREEAARTGQKADERLEERHRQAQRRRRQADTRARARGQGAGERRQQRSRRAAQEERSRLERSREAEAKVEEQIEEQAPVARLDAIEDQTEALREHERALTEADEAKRLERAAERAKAERKDES